MSAESDERWSGKEARKNPSYANLLRRGPSRPKKMPVTSTFINRIVSDSCTTVKQVDEVNAGIVALFDASRIPEFGIEIAVTSVYVMICDETHAPFA